MMARKCIYTGEKATSKDTILPPIVLGDDEKFNWNKNAPAHKDYIEKKANKMPTELELEANETFHMLELAKLKVRFYEKKLIAIQKLIKSGKLNFPKDSEWSRDTMEWDKEVEKKQVKAEKKAKNRRKKEEKLAVHEVQEIQEAEKKIEEKLKKESIWS